jgi:hypothetical protein
MHHSRQLHFRRDWYWKFILYSNPATKVYFRFVPPPPFSLCLFFLFCIRLVVKLKPMAPSSLQHYRYRLYTNMETKSWWAACIELSRFVLKRPTLLFFSFFSGARPPCDDVRRRRLCIPSQTDPKVFNIIWCILLSAVILLARRPMYTGQSPSNAHRCALICFSAWLLFLIPVVCVYNHCCKRNCCMYLYNGWNVFSGFISG